MPQLAIIAGPNGAGKSTAAPFLLPALGIDQFVNADVIARGLSAFRPEQSAVRAGRIMLAQLKDLAGARRDFAFETTLASRMFAPWIIELRDRGYRLTLIFLWLPSADLAVERVSQRVAAGGHDVPEPVVRRRYTRGLRNFFSLYRPIADEWYLYDNGGYGRSRLVGCGIGAGCGMIARTPLLERIENDVANRDS